MIFRLGSFKDSTSSGDSLLLLLLKGAKRGAKRADPTFTAH